MCSKYILKFWYKDRISGIIRQFGHTFYTPPPPHEGAGWCKKARVKCWQLIAWSSTWLSKLKSRCHETSLVWIFSSFSFTLHWYYRILMQHCCVHSMTDEYCYVDTEESPLTKHALWQKKELCYCDYSINKTKVNSGCCQLTDTWSLIHEHTILLGFLGIMLRVLRLEVSVWIS
jgi:hypothetical protein